MKKYIKALVITVIIAVAIICGCLVHKEYKRHELYETIRTLPFNKLPFVKHYGTCDLTALVRDGLR